MFNAIKIGSSEWVETIMKSLEIFWKGMLAIVIVMGVIILVTTIINKISYRKSDGENKQ